VLDKENIDPGSLAPPPENGEYYGRVEFLWHLKKLEKEKQNTGQGAFIKEVIAKKYVPIGESGLRRAVKQFDQHIANGGTWDTFEDEPWNCHKGQKPYLTNADLDEVVCELQTHSGNVLTHDGVSDIITKKQCEKAAAHGIVVLRDEAITPRVGPRRCAQNGLQGVTFGKVHGLTWIISVTQE
jgi:MoaA/NifB/PqqE/SkfB family radical SAM enzyme